MHTAISVPCIVQTPRLISLPRCHSVARSYPTRDHHELDHCSRTWLGCGEQGHMLLLLQSAHPARRAPRSCRDQDGVVHLLIWLDVQRIRDHDHGVNCADDPYPSFTAAFLLQSLLATLLRICFKVMHTLEDARGCCNCMLRQRCYVRSKWGSPKLIMHLLYLFTVVS